jgi:HEAT repeat protein
LNQILSWLVGGDLRSDGDASEVAAFVLANPQVLDDLLDGLSVSDDVVRGRTADALEKIARSRPDLLVNHLDLLVQIANSDSVPMVRMHLAMIFGHLAMYKNFKGDLTKVLLELLGDERVFIRSWAIVSLCIIARMYPDTNACITKSIAPLANDKSVAIRSRTRKAMVVLTNENTPFPKGWVKSEHLQELENRF